MFCWTEVGAQRLSVLHSLVSTCIPTPISSMCYNASIHPDSGVEELTPRWWKELFASNPLRSDLELAVNNVPE